MCVSNSEPSDREREAKLCCWRCPKGTVFIHRIAGRTMIQCACCQRSVFDIDFATAREAWEKEMAA